MNLKGQGALEYLLLIGGAIVVAVIVVTLLLGIGNSTSGQADSSLAAGFCKQKAVIISPPNCTLATNDVCVNKIYWDCAGTYPNCTATKTATAC